MNNEDTNWCILHGEAIIFPSKLPKGAKKIKTTSKDEHIIADSETTGNHHVISVNRGTSFYESGDTTYMVADEPTDVHCVIKDRHDKINIAPGTYEFGVQQEYNHFEKRLEQVRD